MEYAIVYMQKKLIIVIYYYFYNYNSFKLYISCFGWYKTSGEIIDSNTLCRKSVISGILLGGFHFQNRVK